MEEIHDEEKILHNKKLNIRREERLPKTKMNAIGEYIDNYIHILVTVFLADVLLRFYKVLREYFKFKHHYFPEHRLWTILCRAFCYNVSTLIIYLLVIIVGLIRISWDKRLHFIPPTKYFAFMPLWWLVSLSQLGHSTIDYAMFLRENHGLDSASSMAANYFHGYLKLIVPAVTNGTGIRERIDFYEQKHGVKFATNRLVVLIPSKLFIKSKFESPFLEKTKALEAVRRDRAGVYRSYQNDVYRFTKPINNRFYYLSLEGATPILTFFETLNFSLTKTKQTEEMQREVLLKFYKYLRTLVYKWPETEEEIDLILYDDYKSNGEKQDIGEMLYKHFRQLILKMESRNSTASSRNPLEYDDVLHDD